MKNLNSWFAGGLYKNVGARYRYHPTTREELINNINEIVAGGDTNLNIIDTSRIKDMSCLFTRANSVVVSDQVLDRINDLEFDGWNTSHVTTMAGMFRSCTSFTGTGLSNWDTSSVTTTACMFEGCTTFDPDLSGWDTSSVTNMTGMFMDCTSFTGSGLSQWDTSSVTDMSHMFSGCTSFVGHEIENWDVRNVRYATYTFLECTSFNADLSHWDVSGLASGLGMFEGCITFAGTGLGSWRPTRLRSAGRMFKDCKSLEVDLSGWDTALKVDLRTHRVLGGVFTGATRMEHKPEYIPPKLRNLK